MQRFAVATLLTALSCSAQSAITIPPNTKVQLALTSAIWSRTAAPGESVYAVTVFPVAVNNQMAIPPGTYTEGKIDIVVRPTFRSARAGLRMHFTQLIFADGHAVHLPDATVQVSGQPVDFGSAIATVYVLVSSQSDILLDNGSPVEMVLQRPVSLDAGQVAAAIRLSRPPKPAPSKSATLCRLIPGTPGTPDVVIPGTSGTPATPPTVIAGVNGSPDVVIPGSSGTAATPDTVISGSPAASDIPCPALPAVTSASQDFKESFALSHPVWVGGRQLSNGTYQAAWQGLGPEVQVQITRKDKVVAGAHAWIAAAGSRGSHVETSPRPDGSLSMDSLQFSGRTYILRFD